MVESTEQEPGPLLFLDQGPNVECDQRRGCGRRHYARRHPAHETALEIKDELGDIALKKYASRRLLEELGFNASDTDVDGFVKAHMRQQQNS